jgi:hypothetical protein
MAEIPPNIPNVSAGAVLPPKKETGKVQPKKETVRISLPSKPSTAPTIKLPTLPPGGPTGAPTSAVPSAPASAQGAPPRATAAPASAQQRSAPIAKQAASSAAATINPIDRMLIVAAAVAGLFVIGTVIWLMLIPIA